MLKFRFVVALLFFALPLHAQVVGGTISGIATDSTGAALPNAQVLLRNEETGSERRLATDAAGAYAAPSIPVGRYTVTVTREGFAAQIRTGITLTVGQAVHINVALSAGAVAEQVTVTDTPAVVNTSTQPTSGLIDEKQLKELPLNGRSYDQLITLNPGTVNATAQRTGGIGTSNSSVGNMFSVSGRRPQDNLFLLNGIEYTGASLINVTPGGTSGQLLGVDAVREFNVVSDSYSAAYGKRDGAQISIVTTSGTNHLHGGAYEFLRNSFFDARNFFDPARIPNFQRNNFGASLGGPVRKDKLFLFGNYEGFRQNLGISDVTLVPDNQARQGLLPNSAGVETRTTVSPISAQLLNLWPVQNGPEVLQNGLPTGIAEAFSSPEQHIREDFGTTRLDANLTGKDLLFAVFTIDDSTASTPSQDPYSFVNEFLREQVLSVQEQHAFSSRLLNTARAGYSRASFLFLGSVPAAIQAVTPTFVTGKSTGAVVIAGSTASNGASSVTTAGANVGANNAITRNLYTFDDHLFYTRGKHQIEAGIWIQRLESNDNLAQDQFGQASFASLSTFLAGNIKTFTLAPAPTELGWRTLFASFYLEDAFRLTPRLELRAGFRSESSTGWSESQGRAGVYAPVNGVLPSTPAVQSNGLNDNRALFLPEPRLGAAWDIFGNGRTSLRAGAGLHHSLLDALDYRFDQGAPFNTVYSYSGTATTVANPTGGTQAVSPSTVDPAIATPSLIAYSLKLEQQIAPSTSLTVGYSGSHSTHQILSGDLNEPAFTFVNGSIFYPNTTKANPALANSTSWWSGGSGNYNALVVDLRHDLAHGLQLRANYTWSKNLDDGSAWNTSVSANTPAFVEVPSLPHLDYGPAATDIRNLAAVNATYQLPFRGKTRVASGWSLSTIVSAQSGFPFSPQLGYNPHRQRRLPQPRSPQPQPRLRRPALPRRRHLAARGPVLQPRRLLRARLRHRRQRQSRQPARPALRRLGSVAAEGHATDRVHAPAVPRRVLQPAQPHQPADPQPHRLLGRPDAGHRRQPERRRHAGLARADHLHRQHQPPDPAGPEAAVLIACGRGQRDGDATLPYALYRSRRGSTTPDVRGLHPAGARCHDGVLARRDPAAAAVGAGAEPRAPVRRDAWRSGRAGCLWRQAHQRLPRELRQRHPVAPGAGGAVRRRIRRSGLRGGCRRDHCHPHRGRQRSRDRCAGPARRQPPGAAGLRRAGDDPSACHRTGAPAGVGHGVGTFSRTSAGLRCQKRGRAAASGYRRGGCARSGRRGRYRLHPHGGLGADPARRVAAARNACERGGLGHGGAGGGGRRPGGGLALYRGQPRRRAGAGRGVSARADRGFDRRQPHRGRDRRGARGHGRRPPHARRDHGLQVAGPRGAGPGQRLVSLLDPGNYNRQSPMKILTEWLRTYLPVLDVDDSQLAEDLTLRGIAVEGVFEINDIAGDSEAALFDMDITTNRVDAMNHYGIAREAAAIYNLPLHRLDTALPQATDAEPFPVRIEAPDLCGRFTAQVVRGVTVAPSEGVIRHYFTELGLKQISNTVDISNFVLFGMGHPNHVFDLDKLEGGIVVRRARAGEQLRLLDGTTRTLAADDLVIADEKKAISLAGVMGGYDSMITAETKNILIEAAWFDPATIRATSRRHLIHTDASHRYERGADLAAPPVASALVAKEILQACGGHLEGALVDVIVPEQAARTIDRPPISLSIAEVRRILGTTLATEGITPELVAQYLTALGCSLRASARGEWEVQLPSWRLDLTREIDLIEEVARVYGYNRFANTLPTPAEVIPHATERAERAVRSRLFALGFSEAVSSTFASAAECSVFAPATAAIPLENPLSEEAANLRPSLLPGMVTMLAHNLNRDVRAVKLFEAGAIFTGSTTRVEELLSLALGLTGAVAASPLASDADAPFFALKGAVESILKLFATPAIAFTREGIPAAFESSRAATVLVGGNAIAHFGQLSAAEAARRKLRQPVWLAELSLAAVLAYPLRHATAGELSRFQAVERDFSFTFADATPWQSIAAAIHALAIVEMQALDPVEIFRDAKKNPGHFSILIRTVFQSNDRTLTDEDLTGWTGSIIAALESLGGTIRA